jgi:two-component system chemotaxis sensor kinase CheA
MDELVREFISETTESLASVDNALVELERNPGDQATLQSIFRLVHTIKGTCGFLGLSRMEKLAHSAENVLDGLRSGELVANAEIVSPILAVIDRVKSMVSALEANDGVEEKGDDSDLIEMLGEMRGQKGRPAAKAAPAKPEAARAEAPKPEAPRAEPAAEKLPAPAEEKRAVKGLAKAEAAPAAESAIANSSIRVNVELLENLMTMVSELVLTRNQLLQMVRGKDDSEFATPLQRLSHITTDLQEGVMKTRMQPIGTAWSKLPRIVRDLAVETGKKIDLVMLGENTELDRQVLELIKDPLTHMVRNSADHGLEGPDERRAVGKPESGRITLNAYHEGGHIIIEISDDGRGLNVERIKAKAVANGLATESEIENMPVQQVYQFIFKAGFSTAEKVTSVSGRGVGMDVVRTNIEKIGGTIELKSQPGSGSTFVIKIPLTLAIVSALIVECANERFAIPQISVLELVRAAQNSEHTIEVVNNAPVLRLRDRLLPLVSLRSILKLGDVEEAKAETFIVVTQVGTYTFGIMVDRVFDTEEIVVKPVAPILRHINMFSGNTILGDGSVIMILDPNGIASSAGDVGGGGHAAESAAPGLAAETNKISLLVFKSREGDLKAVPLALVARLEEIPVDSIENPDGKLVVQYRGQLMPLVTIDGSDRIRAEKSQPVLVFSDRDRTMGLCVEEIVDIVEDTLRIELSSERTGAIGTAVIAGRATTVIDAGHYLSLAHGHWFGDPNEAAGVPSSHHILLVDDSPFFRNMITPVLLGAGYKVSSADNPAAALALRDQGAAYDLIVSDIEMPGMDGFAFAATVRSDPRWASIPMLALSSHATEGDIERGRAAGFNDYVPKFDRVSVMGAIGRLVKLSPNKAREAA